MKNFLYIFIFTFLMLFLSINAVLAGGDKVHGSLGQGGVYQYCVEPGGCLWE